MPLSFRLTSHPAERAQYANRVILSGLFGAGYANACCIGCCCCCCCLHSVGGLIGGVKGSVKELPPPLREITESELTVSLPPRRVDREGPALSPVVLYWLMVGLLLGGLTLWGYLSGYSLAGAIIEGLGVGLMILPLPQLGASLLSVIAVYLFYADREAALARIGKITRYSVVGALFGLGVMLPFGLLILLIGLLLR